MQSHCSQSRGVGHLSQSSHSKLHAYIQKHSFSKTYSDVRFYKVDVDEVPEVAQELSVRAMPTFTIFKDGVLEETVVGASVGGLEAAIKKVVGA